MSPACTSIHLDLDGSHSCSNGCVPTPKRRSSKGFVPCHPVLNVSRYAAAVPPSTLVFRSERERGGRHCDGRHLAFHRRQTASPARGC